MRANGMSAGSKVLAEVDVGLALNGQPLAAGELDVAKWRKRFRDRDLPRLARLGHVDLARDHAIAARLVALGE